MKLELASLDLYTVGDYAAAQFTAFSFGIGWRLPTLDELKYLIESNTLQSSHLTYDFTRPYPRYWTSTEHPEYPGCYFACASVESKVHSTWDAADTVIHICLVRDLKDN